jgi:hypothetical protein
MLTLKDCVIALSPLVNEEGTEPHRVVLKEFDSQFVIHDQWIDENGARHYSGGNYYVYGERWGPNSDTRLQALQKAWDAFYARTRRRLRLDAREAK